MKLAHEVKLDHSLYLIILPPLDVKKTEVIKVDPLSTCFTFHFLFIPFLVMVIYFFIEFKLKYNLILDTLVIDW